MIRPGLRHAAILLSAVIAVTGAAAQAAIVSVDGAYTVGANPTVSAANGPSATPVGVFGQDPFSFSMFQADADPGGLFRVRAGGGGDFSARGHSLFSETVTNSSGQAAAYNFTFTVDAGRLENYLNMTPPSGGAVTSGFTLVIRLNGSAIWTATADLEKSAPTSGAALTLGGQDVGGTLTHHNDNFSVYEWAAYSDTLALGTFANGASFTVEYEMTTVADGALSTPFYYEGYANARIGDPNTIGSAPGFGIASEKLVAVPEAPGAALLAAGIGFVGIARRRRAAGKTATVAAS